MLDFSGHRGERVLVTDPTPFQFLDLAERREGERCWTRH
jgi:hypothetical protein